MRDPICKDIEKNLNMEFNASADYTALSEMIYSSTGKTVSSSTLKRMWGYNREDVKPRRSTLDILARFLGYKNYSTYIKGDAESQSYTVVSKHLYDRDIQVGQKIKVSWNPDRTCVVLCDEPGHFQIVEAINTKLMVGDTFRCRIFIENEPLYMYSLCHGKCAPAIYVAGRKDGIRFDFV